MRSKEELNDFLEVDLEHEIVKTVHSGRGSGAPPYGITQRAYFNKKFNEIRIVIGSGISPSRKGNKNNFSDGEQYVFGFKSISQLYK